MSRLSDIDELAKVRRELSEANNLAGIWLTRAAELEDKRQQLRSRVCGVKPNAQHAWEIDAVGNETYPPRTRAFCLRCGDVMFL